MFRRLLNELLIVSAMVAAGTAFVWLVQNPHAPLGDVPTCSRCQLPLVPYDDVRYGVCNYRCWRCGTAYPIVPAKRLFTEYELRQPIVDGDR